MEVTFVSLCARLVDKITSSSSSAKIHKSWTKELSKRAQLAQPYLTRLLLPGSAPETWKGRLTLLHTSLQKTADVLQDCSRSRLYCSLSYNPLVEAIEDAYISLSDALQDLGETTQLDTRLPSPDLKTDLLFGNLELAYRKGRLDREAFVDALLDGEEIAESDVATCQSELVDLRNRMKKANKSGLEQGLEDDAHLQQIIEHLASLCQVSAPEAPRFVVPPGYLCSICHLPMLDPVSTTFGHTYDRLCIQKWFQSGGCTNPSDGQVLQSTKVVSNIALRQAVEFQLSDLEPFKSRAREEWGQLIGRFSWEEPTMGSHGSTNNPPPEGVPNVPIIPRIRCTTAVSSEGPTVPPRAISQEEPFSAGHNRRFSDAGSAMVPPLPRKDTKEVETPAGSCSHSHTDSLPSESSTPASTPRHNGGIISQEEDPKVTSVGASPMGCTKWAASDDKNPLELYRVAANSGDAAAQFALGCSYFMGLGVTQDMEQGVHWLQEAAKQGHADAQADLGWCYDNGLGVPKDQVQAIQWYREAAEQGNPAAQCSIGRCYANAKDLVLAFVWYEKAALQGDVDAQFNVAWCYDSGSGVPKDLAAAFKWYEKASLQGHADAQCHLGYYCINGWGTPKDIGKAIQWYRKSAEQGNPVAQHNLGRCYRKGWGVAKDHTKAVHWFQKAGEQGDANSQTNMGWSYVNGIGVDKDLSKAYHWYRKAAKQGNAAGQCHLGYFYMNGLGVAKDPVVAVKWFLRAAEQGHADAQANLGWCYDNGLGVVRDLGKAIDWYQSSAALGDSTAQCHLGYCFINGVGMPMDLSKGVAWFRRSAEQGNAEAQANLGRCFDQGQGVEKDMKAAVEWYAKSAEQGNNVAQYNLGRCYVNGLGVKKDVSKAAEWFLMAAEQGNADGCTSLGWCYDNGQGVVKDQARAVQWFYKAAEQGNAYGQANLGECYEFGRGVETNLKEAARWYCKAAIQGQHFSLGVCYENGWGVVKNLARAEKEYRMAKELGWTMSRFRTRLHQVVFQK